MQLQIADCRLQIADYELRRLRPEAIFCPSGGYRPGLQRPEARGTHVQKYTSVIPGFVGCAFDGADGAEGSRGTRLVTVPAFDAPCADAVDKISHVLVAGEDGAADIAGHAVAGVVDGQPVQVDGRRLRNSNAPDARSRFGPAADDDV